MHCTALIPRSLALSSRSAMCLYSSGSDDVKEAFLLFHYSHLLQKKLHVCVCCLVFTYDNGNLKCTHCAGEQQLPGAASTRVHDGIDWDSVILYIVYTQPRGTITVSVFTWGC